MSLSKPIRHIAVAGNIGSGKTTLVERLSKHYGWEPLYESVNQNPYIEDFYADMRKWAFHLQIYFLNNRFNQSQFLKTSDLTVIQDRTIYEDAYIFARNLYEEGYLDRRDYNNYLSVFTSMMEYIKHPDLLIYLRANVPKLVQQIALRNRAYEYKIQIEYLQDLHRHYENWIAEYHGRLIIIDVNDLDFVNVAEDFAFVVQRLELELHNLFD